MIKIDILCPVCLKCNKTEQVIRRALKILKAEATITHLTDFRQFSKYSVNVSKTPIVVINGAVEFAGCVPDLELLQKKLLDIIMGR